MQEFFQNTFRSVNIPIIVCGSGEQLPLEFVNTKAKVLLDPYYSAPANRGDPPRTLRQLLRFVNPGILDDVIDGVRAMGSVNHYRAEAVDFEDRPVPVSLSANLVSLLDKEYIVLYVSEDEDREMWSDREMAGVVHQAFHIAYHSESVPDAINRILRLTGSYARVSRAYIYEEQSGGTVRNTYCWQAEHARPIALREHPSDNEDYMALMDAGVFACSDASDLKKRSYSLLTGEDVRSLAVAALYHIDRPLGYIGIDACDQQHIWSGKGIALLKSVADVLASLLIRRNAEDKARRTQRILGIVSDTMDSTVYVSSLDTMEIMFANKALTDSLSLSQEQVLGRPCWQVLRPDLAGPCEWCPVVHMVSADGSVRRDTYQWEYQIPATGKWYLGRDSIIPWVDGQTVHLHTATEITRQKEIELELERTASTDSLTGVYNREWGYRQMQSLKAIPRQARGDISLCFIDLDGLKDTNDTYGHKAGDTRIKRTVEVIQHTIRKMDVLFRWGGDEFIVLLRCSMQDAERVMRHIQEKLTPRSDDTGALCYLGFSYGITDFNAVDAEGIDAVMAKADQKMYHNKVAKQA